MTQVFVERDFDPAITAQELSDMVAGAEGCLSLWHVTWRGSLLSRDGSKMLCQFEGADTESVKNAFRQAGANIKALWPGTMHTGPEELPVTTVVERYFDDPSTVEAMQAIEDAGSDCLKQRNVTFIRTYFSHDKKHMVCLYNAPDTESVREAQRQAQMPVSLVWPCQFVGPSPSLRALT